MSLTGKTAFITGASRGIGREIALKLAKNGANVVIAAKTVNPHPKLPGTIHSAVEEIKSIGGNAMACELDIRSEEMIQKSVKAAVANFGGIDFLINNASALALSSLESLETKKLDLMLSINVRGTLLCIKNSLPHLFESPNPHVLNLSPPVPLDLGWYRNNAAYTITKAAMSGMIAGFAEDYRDRGVAFNTLWPKTAIKTAAIDMLMGKDENNFSFCRKPGIMADAAYEVLRRDSRSFTKNFLIDEDFLRENGVSDFSQYNYVENPTLMDDLFIGEPADNKIGAKLDVFTKVNQILLGVSESSDLKFSVRLSDTNQTWNLDLNSTPPQFLLSTKPYEIRLTASSQTFSDILFGQVDPMMAFSAGNLSYHGDQATAMRIIGFINKMKNHLK